MQTPRTLLLAIASFVLMTSTANAYTMIVDGPDLVLGSTSVGQLVSWDVYIDTDGASGITLLSFSRTYDPTILQYRPDLSDANEDYPLYAPSPGKGELATWLTPNADPPEVWDGALPPIGGQVNVEFLEANLGETVATSTHAYLATLTFEVVGVGLEGGTWSFYNEGNTFLANGVESRDDVSWVFVPEPSTALLVGLGLAGLALAARPRP